MILFFFVTREKKKKKTRWEQMHFHIQKKYANVLVALNVIIQQNKINADCDGKNSSGMRMEC